MIFYFSATGNSRYVAQQISKATGEEAYDLLKIMGRSRKNAEKTGEEAQTICVNGLSADERIGIVSPTYYFGLPPIVIRFIQQIKVQQPPYLYFVATCGAMSGWTSGYARLALKKNGLRLDATYSVKMPDSWTPMADLSDERKVSAINNAAEDKIANICQQITAKEKGNHTHGSVPHFLAHLSQKWGYESSRQTKHLHVDTNKCNGCGRCYNLCPTQSINMDKGYPEWVNGQCLMCLGCLHRCPKFAIQYDNKTQKHGQYQHPEAK